MRSVIRVQEGQDHLRALYLYNSLATMERAREWIMDYLSQDESGLIPQIITTEGYTDERDARELLRRVEKSYEPVRLPLLFEMPE